jgi:Cu-Zn family superoxide dismutase
MHKFLTFAILTFTLLKLSFSKEAVCRFTEIVSMQIDGEVKFTQEDEKSPLTITGKVTNMKPNTMQGFHIHQFANFTDGCKTAGAHYNPFNKNHGSPNDLDRHVGDMGNIVTNEYGVGIIDYTDSVITLFGEKTIIGKACVVHMDPDDLGKGGNEDSLKTGNAGGRVACGEVVEVYAGSWVWKLLLVGALLGLAYYCCYVRTNNRYLAMANHEDK